MTDSETIPDLDPSDHEMDGAGPRVVAGVPRGAVMLLERAIDYAGLFPPASLDMSATVASYARGLAGDAAWLLERIVIPAARLDEFETVAAEHLPTDDDGDPWPISALVAAADDPDALGRDIERIGTFNARHCAPEAGLCIVDAIELRATSAAAIDTALDRIPAEIFPFFEIDAAVDPRGMVATLVGGDAGAKIRTGGVTPDLYPEPAHVARFLHACAAVDVPFKATAGLHHPWRHPVPGGAEAFGFFNVLAAAVMAHARQATTPDLEHMLIETGPDRLTVDDDGLAWDGERVSCQEIEDVRLVFAISFGSCSYDEPWDDLRSIGRSD